MSWAKRNARHLPHVRGDEPRQKTIAKVIKASKRPRNMIDLQTDVRYNKAKKLTWQIKSQTALYTKERRWRLDHSP